MSKLDDVKEAFAIHREARANAFEEVRRWAAAEERDTRKLLQARRGDPTMQVALHGRMGQLYRLRSFLDEREGESDEDRKPETRSA